MKRTTQEPPSPANAPSVEVSDLCVGDFVFVMERDGHELHRVARVSIANIVIDDGRSFTRKGGLERGARAGHRAMIVPASAELSASYTPTRAHRKLAMKIRSFPLEQLSVHQLSKLEDWLKSSVPRKR